MLFSGAGGGGGGLGGEGNEQIFGWWGALPHPPSRQNAARGNPPT